MTLPLIHLLDKSTILEKRKIINIIKNHNTNDEKVAWLIGKVKDAGGFDYAFEKMMEKKNEAIGLLRQFPDNRAREALINLINYSTERKNRACP